MIIKNKYATIVANAIATGTAAWAQKWTQPDAPSATATHAAVTLTAVAQTVTTAITQPDFPRIVTVKGNAGGIAGNVVVSGTDIRGNAISDTIALNAGSEVLGIKAFASVDSILLPAKTNVSGDTVSIGIGDKLGLEMIPDYAIAISAHHNATLEGTLPTITRHATDIAQNIVDFNSACNADHDQAVVYYTSEKPQRIKRTL